MAGNRHFIKKSTFKKNASISNDVVFYILYRAIPKEEGILHYKRSTRRAEPNKKALYIAK